MKIVLSLLYQYISDMAKLFFISALVIILGSCSGQKEVQKSAVELNSVPVKADEVKPEELPVKEIEEKVVEVEKTAEEDFDYYVIIGSFRNKENALNYQQDISRKGFSPYLLKNEAGLYRVAVRSFNDIGAARSEVRRIRSAYPEHKDTWLLIRMK